MFERICKIFSPSGEENEMKDFLVSELSDFADSFFEDNFGNLVFHKEGKGEKICFECGIDKPFLAFSATDGEKMRFATPPQIDVKKLVGKEMVFKNGKSFVLKSETLPEKSTVSKVYAETKKTSYVPKVFEPAVEKSFFAESENDFSSSSARYEAMIYVMCRLIKEIKNSPFDLYFAFTVQKCLGARGEAALLESRNFHKVISLVCLEEDKYAKAGDGALIFAKGGRIPLSVCIKDELLAAAKKSDTKHKIVLRDENLYFNLPFSCGIGALSGACGIVFDNKSINRDKILKCDIENITKMLKSYCKG